MYSLFLATHIEYNSIDARVSVVSLLGLSLIPMIMYVHMSLFIAGAVPVGGRALVSQYNPIQNVYAPFISLQ